MIHLEGIFLTHSERNSLEDPLARVQGIGKLDIIEIERLAAIS